MFVQETGWTSELLESRKRLKEEVSRAFYCKTGEQKRALYNQWCKRYSEDHVKTLVNVAKDREISLRIIAWNVENFGKSPNVQDGYSISRGRK